MIYIFGTSLKKNKKTRIALTYIYGIGDYNASVICNTIGIGSKTKVKKMTNTQIYNIRKIIKKDYKITGDLRKYISLNIKRYIEIKSYRGLRHKLSYPVRGQRTHTNAITQKKLSRQRFDKINVNDKKQKISQIKNKIIKKK